MVTDQLLNGVGTKPSIVLTPTAYEDGVLNSVKPSDGNADFDFTRGSSATRVNEKGLVQDVQLVSGELVQNGDFEQIGSEEVTNGGFDNSSSWGMQSSWSISNGSANYDGILSHYIEQSNVFSANTNYKITFTISNNTSGIISIRDGAAATLVPNTNYTNATHTFYIKSNTNTALRIYGVGGSGTLSIDNVSVKEVGQNWSFTDGAFFTENGINITNSPTAGGLNTDGYTPLVIGRKYRMTYEIIENNAGLIKLVSAIDETMVSTVGTHTKEFIAQFTDIIIFRSGSTVDVTIDNISVIEITDDTDLPRINYTNFDYEDGEVVPYSGEGSLLLEPQSTNLYPYSEDFTQWFQPNANVVLTSNKAPNGTTNSVYNLTGTSANLYLGGTTGVEHTISFYIKSNNQGKDRFKLRLGNNTSVEYIATNKWVRYEFTSTPTTSVFGITTTSSPNNEFDLLIWGAQSEALSYATSYIPTNGSTVTRLADVCNNSGNSDLFNDSEGVLMFEGGSLSELDVTARYIQMSDGTSTPNGIQLRYYTSTNLFQALYYTNSAYQAVLSYTLPNSSENNKIAFKYKENDFALWVNGIEVATDLNGITGASLSKLKFDYNNFSHFYGNVKCVAVFKEALSDEELQKLTT